MVDGMILCHASNYTKGRGGSVAYLVMHYTANDGDTAEGNCKYFTGPNRGASAHYFVDENGFRQSVREEDTAWHCGASIYRHPSCRNANSIGIELCSRKDVAGNYYIKAETVQNAVQLVRALMDKYGVPTGRILRHYDVTGKECPRPWVRDEAQWRAFLEALSGKEEEEMPVMYKTRADVPVWGAAAVENLMKKGYLQGNEKGELNLTEDMLRLLVINHRAGLYDKP